MSAPADLPAGSWPRLHDVALALRRGKADRRPLMAAVGALHGGGLVAVYPEGTRCPPGSRRRWRPEVDVLVGEPRDIPDGGGRAGLATATETVRAALAGMVDELDEVRSRA